MDGKRCKFSDPAHNGHHCGSYAFNLAREDVKQGDYCDVHYWRVRCEKAESAALSQPAAAPLRLPENATEVRLFIGPHAHSTQFKNAPKDPEDWRGYLDSESSDEDNYHVSAHDLLICFRDWVDFPIYAAPKATK